MTRRMVPRRIFVAALLLTLALPAQPARSAAPDIPVYDLIVSFDIPRSKLTGLARVRASGGERLQFQVGRLAVQSVSVRGKPARYAVRDGTLSIDGAQSGAVEIRYSGVFKSSTAASSSRDADIPGVIGREGIFLASAWYPQISEPAIYRLTAALPEGYIAVSEAESIQTIKNRSGITFAFEFRHPADGITLVASDRYRIARDRFRGIELSAYFFPEDQGLARRYLDYAKKYIRLYEQLLSPFPFKRFAVVENFLPTGYSMPTYTLLGQAVVRLPFIVETSLGHEILHQWFGNQVYGGANGNWVEGLTTYLADHLYEAEKGEGARYRKQILVDYRNYVGAGNDFALRAFTGRFDAASRTIGYGKAAMVFHMLRKTLGAESFFGALKSFLGAKQFQRATWDDLKDAFERQSGRELGWFFSQWLNRTGLLELQISDPRVERNRGAVFLNFDLIQKGELYRVDVPLKVRIRSGNEKNATVLLAERQKRVTLELEEEPSELVVDEHFDLARTLADAEIPPTIGSLIGFEKPIVVQPVRDEASYGKIIERFRAHGASVKDGASLSDAELRAATLVIFGGDHPVVRKLFGKAEIAENGFDVIVKKHPWNADKTVGIISARSAGEAAAAFAKIFHYGKYSRLAFENGRNVAATIAPSQSGMRAGLSEDPPAVDPSTLKTLSTVIDKLASKKIVYVGEEHDNYSHHRVQLEILRGLYRQNPKLAVGMEMFQRQNQKALDDYVAGAIDEQAFLKQSEYFKRWSMDYHLYKPILDFARENRLPVVALNLPRDIVRKVGRSGLESLSPGEKMEVPREMDFSDQEYRARLKDVFAAHAGSGAKNFDFFHQAQLLWDETMAESIDRFLRQNPDYRMLVMAGNGHLEYGAGIPKRSFRRNQFDYGIVLNDGKVKKAIADFIVYPESSTGPKAPLLMVTLVEQNQEARISGFAKDSVAAKAGLKVDDVLISLDDRPIAGVDDVRIALFYKRAGESIKVRARRGSAELEFSVELQ